VQACGVAAMLALDFLQEHDVRAERAQVVAQLVDHQATVELRETFVDVVGGDVELHAGGELICLRQATNLSILSEKPHKRPPWLGNSPLLVYPCGASGHRSGAFFTSSRRSAEANPGRRWSG